MPSKKETAKSCVYPCPEGCGETALYINNDDTLASIKEDGVEGYDLVYVADHKHKHVFMFGNPKSVGAGPEVDLTQSVHTGAYERASRGEVVNYEWVAEKGENTCYFQSTLIPLADSSGGIGSVLGLVKNITPWAYSYAKTRVLKDVGGHTFSQILLATREEEKRKISSALHDEIGSAAVILTSLLSMVKESVLSQDQKQALTDIAHLDKQLKESIERVKNILVSLRPLTLESAGLMGAVRELLENTTRYSGIKHKLIEEEDGEEEISDNVKIMLYRVVQESLNNIVKHSKAKNITVEINRGEKEVNLRITDDGVGFKPPKYHSIRNVGLLSMRDSVAYLGGKFSIKSEPGKGTTIEVTCPRIVYGVKRI